MVTLLYIVYTMIPHTHKGVLLQYRINAQFILLQNVIVIRQDVRAQLVGLLGPK